MNRQAEVARQVTNMYHWGIWTSQQY